MKPKIFVTRPVGRRALDVLAGKYELSVHEQDAAIPEAQLAEACREVEGLLLAGSRLSEAVLSSASKLRAVSTPSVGYDNIDVAACTRRRIPVMNTAGALEETTADLAFTLLLAVARRVLEADRFVRDGRWTHWQWGMLHGANVHHKTLGLYGFGKIGQAMARRGRGFSMRILYYARHRVAESVERALEAQYVDRETLLRESDFVSLHVPLTAETRHAIQARELGMMKPSAFLINTARGAVVDEESLARTLVENKIAGAGLDVFEHEPKVHPALAKLANVVLMPHVGSATAETREAMAVRAAQNLLAALDGQRPPSVVNPEVFR